VRGALKTVAPIDSSQDLKATGSHAVDGDGDLDAFIANEGANKVWLNDGTGNFTNSGQRLGGSSSRGVVLGDLDGDGDLDAFVSNWGESKVWLNDGRGSFTDSGQNLGTSNGQVVALGDLDNDGDLDAFMGNYDEADKVWLNQSQGSQ
jgi:hypothetical protein